MNTFLLILERLVQISLLITGFQVYLRVNKIWKRKHEREVAESQSIAGLLLLILNCIIWILYYIFLETDTKSVIDTSLYLFESIIFVIISTGFFVEGQSAMGLFTLAKRALRLERKEADYLLKKFLKPANAGAIIDILYQLAMIDDDLDPKEEEIIRVFAKEWGIKFDKEEMLKNRSSDKQGNFMRLRKSVEEYLSKDPQKEQVAQLKDMMQTMIEADDEITAEEELISSELIGLVENFINDNDAPDAFHVMIVPQNKDHHESIKNLNQGATEFNIAGGVAYSVGSFYSKKYAEMICDQYREEKLFTIVHNPDPK